VPMDQSLLRPTFRFRKFRAEQIGPREPAPTNQGSAMISARGIAAASATLTAPSPGPFPCAGQPGWFSLSIRLVRRFARSS
jgi:hypothetical protein